MKTIKKNSAGVKVSGGIKAGALGINHNRRLAALAVQSGIKAGTLLTRNHNRRLA
jgi:hypothetical protein